MLLIKEAPLLFIYLLILIYALLESSKCQYHLALAICSMTYVLLSVKKCATLKREKKVLISKKGEEVVLNNTEVYVNDLDRKLFWQMMRMGTIYLFSLLAIYCVCRSYLLSLTAVLLVSCAKSRCGKNPAANPKTRISEIATWSLPGSMLIALCAIGLFSSAFADRLDNENNNVILQTSYQVRCKNDNGSWERMPRPCLSIPLGPLSSYLMSSGSKDEIAVLLMRGGVEINPGPFCPVNLTARAGSLRDLDEKSRLTVSVLKSAMEEITRTMSFNAAPHDADPPHAAWHSGSSDMVSRLLTLQATDEVSNDSLQNFLTFHMAMLTAEGHKKGSIKKVANPRADMVDDKTLVLTGAPLDVITMEEIRESSYCIIVHSNNLNFIPSLSIPTNERIGKPVNVACSYGGVVVILEVSNHILLSQLTTWERCEMIDLYFPYTCLSISETSLEANRVLVDKELAELIKAEGLDSHVLVKNYSVLTSAGALVHDDWATVDLHPAEQPASSSVVGTLTCDRLDCGVLTGLSVLPNKSWYEPQEARGSDVWHPRYSYVNVWMSSSKAALDKEVIPGCETTQRALLMMRDKVNGQYPLELSTQLHSLQSMYEFASIYSSAFNCPIFIEVNGNGLRIKQSADSHVLHNDCTCILFSESIEALTERTVTCDQISLLTSRLINSELKLGYEDESTRIVLREACIKLASMMDGLHIDPFDVHSARRIASESRPISWSLVEIEGNYRLSSIKYVNNADVTNFLTNVVHTPVSLHISAPMKRSVVTFGSSTRVRPKKLNIDETMEMLREKVTVTLIHSGKLYTSSDGCMVDFDGENKFDHDISDLPPDVFIIGTVAYRLEPTRSFTAAPADTVAMDDEEKGRVYAEQYFGIEVDKEDVHRAVDNTLLVMMPPQPELQDLFLKAYQANPASAQSVNFANLAKNERILNLIIEGRDLMANDPTVVLMERFGRKIYEELGIRSVGYEELQKVEGGTRMPQRQAYLTPMPNGSFTVVPIDESQPSTMTSVMDAVRNITAQLNQQCRSHAGDYRKAATALEMEVRTGVMRHLQHRLEHLRHDLAGHISSALLGQQYQGDVRAVEVLESYEQTMQLKTVPSARPFSAGSRRLTPDMLLFATNPDGKFISGYIIDIKVTVNAAVAASKTEEKYGEITTTAQQRYGIPFNVAIVSRTPNSTVKAAISHARLGSMQREVSQYTSRLIAEAEILLDTAIQTVSRARQILPAEDEETYVGGLTMDAVAPEVLKSAASYVGMLVGQVNKYAADHGDCYVDKVYDEELKVTFDLCISPERCSQELAKDISTALEERIAKKEEAPTSTEALKARLQKVYDGKLVTYNMGQSSLIPLFDYHHGPEFVASAESMVVPHDEYTQRARNLFCEKYAVIPVVDDDRFPEKDKLIDSVDSLSSLQQLLNKRCLAMAESLIDMYTQKGDIDHKNIITHLIANTCILDQVLFLIMPQSSVRHMTHIKCKNLLGKGARLTIEGRDVVSSIGRGRMIQITRKIVDPQFNKLISRLHRVGLPHYAARYTALKDLYLEYLHKYGVTWKRTAARYGFGMDPTEYDKVKKWKKAVNLLRSYELKKIDNSGDSPDEREANKRACLEMYDDDCSPQAISLDRLMSMNKRTLDMYNVDSYDQLIERQQQDSAEMDRLLLSSISAQNAFYDVNAPHESAISDMKEAKDNIVKNVNEMEEILERADNAYYVLAPDIAHAGAMSSKGNKKDFKHSPPKYIDLADDEAREVSMKIVKQVGQLLRTTKEYYDENMQNDHYEMISNCLAGLKKQEFFDEAERIANSNCNALSTNANSICHNISKYHQRNCTIFNNDLLSRSMSVYYMTPRDNGEGSAIHMMLLAHDGSKIESIIDNPERVAIYTEGSVDDQETKEDDDDNNSVYSFENYDSDAEDEDDLIIDMRDVRMDKPLPNADIPESDFKFGRKNVNVAIAFNDEQLRKAQRGKPSLPLMVGTVYSTGASGTTSVSGPYSLRHRDVTLLSKASVSTIETHYLSILSKSILEDLDFEYLLGYVASPYLCMSAGMHSATAKAGTLGLAALSVSPDHATMFKNLMYAASNPIDVCFMNNVMVSLHNNAHLNRPITSSTRISAQSFSKQAKTINIHDLVYPSRSPSFEDYKLKSEMCKGLTSKILRRSRTKQSQSVKTEVMGHQREMFKQLRAEHRDLACYTTSFNKQEIPPMGHQAMFISTARIIHSAIMNCCTGSKKRMQRIVGDYNMKQEKFGPNSGLIITKEKIKDPDGLVRLKGLSKHIRKPATVGENENIYLGPKTIGFNLADKAQSAITDINSCVKKISEKITSGRPNICSITPKLQPAAMDLANDREIMTGTADQTIFDCFNNGSSILETSSFFDNELISWTSSIVPGGGPMYMNYVLTNLDSLSETLTDFPGCGLFFLSKDLSKYSTMNNNANWIMIFLYCALKFRQAKNADGELISTLMLMMVLSRCNKLYLFDKSSYDSGLERHTSGLVSPETSRDYVHFYAPGGLRVVRGWEQGYCNPLGSMIGAAQGKVMNTIYPRIDGILNSSETFVYADDGAVAHVVDMAYFNRSPVTTARYLSELEEIVESSKGQLCNVKKLKTTTVAFEIIGNTFFAGGCQLLHNQVLLTLQANVQFDGIGEATRSSFSAARDAFLSGTDLASILYLLAGLEKANRSFYREEYRHLRNVYGLEVDDLPLSLGGSVFRKGGQYIIYYLVYGALSHDKHILKEIMDMPDRPGNSVLLSLMDYGLQEDHVESKMLTETGGGSLFPIIRSTAPSKFKTARTVAQAITVSTALHYNAYKSSEKKYRGTSMEGSPRFPEEFEELVDKFLDPSINDEAFEVHVNMIQSTLSKTMISGTAVPGLLRSTGTLKLWEDGSEEQTHLMEENKASYAEMNRVVNDDNLIYSMLYVTKSKLIALMQAGKTRAAITLVKVNTSGFKRWVSAWENFNNSTYNEDIDMSMEMLNKEMMNKQIDAEPEKIRVRTTRALEMIRTAQNLDDNLVKCRKLQYGRMFPIFSSDGDPYTNRSRMFAIYSLRSIFDGDITTDDIDVSKIDDMIENLDVEVCSGCSSALQIRLAMSQNMSKSKSRRWVDLTARIAKHLLKCHYETSTHECQENMIWLSLCHSPLSLVDITAGDNAVMSWCTKHERFDAAINEVKLRVFNPDHSITDDLENLCVNMVEMISEYMMSGVVDMARSGELIVDMKNLECQLDVQQILRRPLLRQRDRHNLVIEEDGTWLGVSAYTANTTRFAKAKASTAKKDVKAGPESFDVMSTKEARLSRLLSYYPNVYTINHAKSTHEMSIGREKFLVYSSDTLMSGNTSWNYRSVPEYKDVRWLGKEPTPFIGSLIGFFSPIKGELATYGKHVPIENTKLSNRIWVHNYPIHIGASRVWIVVGKGTLGAIPWTNVITEVRKASIESSEGEEIPDESEASILKSDYNANLARITVERAKAMLKGTMQMYPALELMKIPSSVLMSLQKAYSLMFSRNTHQSFASDSGDRLSRARKTAASACYNIRMEDVENDQQRAKLIERSLRVLNRQLEALKAKKRYSENIVRKRVTKMSKAEKDSAYRKDDYSRYTHAQIEKIQKMVEDYGEQKEGLTLRLTFREMIDYLSVRRGNVTTQLLERVHDNILLDAKSSDYLQNRPALLASLRSPGTVSVVSRRRRKMQTIEKSNLYGTVNFGKLLKFMMALHNPSDYETSALYIRQIETFRSLFQEHKRFNKSASDEVIMRMLWKQALAAEGSTSLVLCNVRIPQSDTVMQLIGTIPYNLNPSTSCGVVPMPDVAGDDIPDKEIKDCILVANSYKQFWQLQGTPDHDVVTCQDPNIGVEDMVRKAVTREQSTAIMNVSARLERRYADSENNPASRAAAIKTHDWRWRYEAAMSRYLIDGNLSLAAWIANDSESKYRRFTWYGGHKTRTSAKRLLRRRFGTCPWTLADLTRFEYKPSGKGGKLIKVVPYMNPFKLAVQSGFGSKDEQMLRLAAMPLNENSVNEFVAAKRLLPTEDVLVKMLTTSAYYAQARISIHGEECDGVASSNSMSLDSLAICLEFQRGLKIPEPDSVADLVFDAMRQINLTIEHSNHGGRYANDRLGVMNVLRRMSLLCKMNTRRYDANVAINGYRQVLRESDEMVARLGASSSKIMHGMRFREYIGKMGDEGADKPAMNYFALLNNFDSSTKQMSFEIVSLPLLGDRLRASTDVMQVLFVPNVIICEVPKRMKRKTLDFKASCEGLTCPLMTLSLHRNPPLSFQESSPMRNPLVIQFFCGLELKLATFKDLFVVRPEQLHLYLEVSRYEHKVFSHCLRCFLSWSQPSKLITRAATSRRGLLTLNDTLNDVKSDESRSIGDRLSENIVMMLETTPATSDESDFKCVEDYSTVYTDSKESPIWQEVALAASEFRALEGRLSLMMKRIYRELRSPDSKRKFVDWLVTGHGMSDTALLSRKFLMMAVLLFTAKYTMRSDEESRKRQSIIETSKIMGCLDSLFEMYKSKLIDDDDEAADFREPEDF